MQLNGALRRILEDTRQRIREHAGEDPDKWWYANRFVFARLQLDERKTKVRIKRDLLDAGGPCHSCGKPFETRRDVHLHRLDASRGYHRGNCVLMHAECHRRWHAEHQDGDSREAASDAGARGRPILSVKVSKPYDGMPFAYWWDISPSLAAGLDEMEVLEFVKKDPRERCVVPVDVLRRYLLPERQTTRSGGNWGVKVLKDHEDELAFEPGAGGGEWLFLPVVWLADAED